MMGDFAVLFAMTVLAGGGFSRKRAELVRELLRPSLRPCRVPSVVASIELAGCGDGENGVVVLC